MKDVFLRLSLSIHAFLAPEDGQDLVEYALLVALVSLAAVAGLGVVANSIKSEFSTIAHSV
jgi:pilus assembly protein Flp/PilA